jgi:polyisoprenoid-binding protein YceI
MSRSLGTKMMRRWAAVLACLVVYLGISTSAVAQDLALHFAPAETKVEFTLGDVLHTVHGTFQLKRGEFHFTADSGKASGELAVDATSGASGNATRDRRMTNEILETARFPEIVFRPDRLDGQVAAQGHSQVQVHGEFTIHGEGHEILIPVEVDANAGVYTITLRFTVPYQKWGMKNPSMLLLRVGDKVEITVHAVGR